MPRLFNYDTNNIRVVRDDNNINFYSKAELSVKGENGYVVIFNGIQQVERILFTTIKDPSYPTLDQYIVAIQGWIDEYIAPDEYPNGELLNLIENIQVNGGYNGKKGYVFHIVGRRSGFNNTTVPHDLKEFDAASTFFTQLTGTEPLEIVSSSANDAAAGTGIRTVKVVYIDTDNNIAESSSITLNGTTPVALSFLANEILWMESASSGNLRVAQGNIRLRVVSGSVEIEQITQNSSKSKTGKFMVPVGYTGYIDSWNGAAINNDQDLFILSQCDSFTRELTSAYHMEDNLYTPVNTPSTETEMGFKKIPALARVKLSTVSSGTAAAVRASATFTIAIIED